MHAHGRVLDPSPLVPPGLSRLYRSCYGGLGLPWLHPCLRRLSKVDNHDLYLLVVIQLRDVRVHGIITLHDVDPVVGESQNGLSPAVDGTVPSEKKAYLLACMEETTIERSWSIPGF